MSDDAFPHRQSRFDPASLCEATWRIYKTFKTHQRMAYSALYVFHDVQDDYLHFQPVPKGILPWRYLRESRERGHILPTQHMIMALDLKQLFRDQVPEPYWHNLSGYEIFHALPLITLGDQPTQQTFRVSTAFDRQAASMELTVYTTPGDTPPYRPRARNRLKGGSPPPYLRLVPDE